MQPHRKIFQALQSERALHSLSLPLAPYELPTITLSRTAAKLGIVDTPSCPPPSSLSITRFRTRVNPGSAVSFVLAQVGDLEASYLDELAHHAQVVAVPQVADGASAAQATEMITLPAEPLPVTYEASATHGGVLISVSVPASTPVGSCIVISRASVAGCDIALDRASRHIVVGFNHIPVPQGHVSAAARSGNVPDLVRLLDGGASTEEKDAVRYSVCCPTHAAHTGSTRVSRTA
jgi:hypothetical protein